MKPFVNIAGDHAVKQTMLLIEMGTQVTQLVRLGLVNENSRIFLLWQMLMENESDHLRFVSEHLAEAPLK